MRQMPGTEAKRPGCPLLLDLFGSVVEGSAEASEEELGGPEPDVLPRLAPSPRFHAPSRGERVTACEAILSLLRVRPRTSAELSDAGGLNYRARVSDLRKAGHRIVCKRDPDRTGVNVYALLPCAD